jgi:N-acetylneuraminate synthase/sialic acid synthase
MGKKLVAARDLTAGSVLSRADIAIKSPNDGLPPYELEHVLGRTLKRNLTQDENLTFEDLV